jgi:hypothetical protein
MEIAGQVIAAMTAAAPAAVAGSRLPDCPKDTRVQWSGCRGTRTYPDGIRYVGEWERGKYHGRGTLSMEDGHRISGSFKDGKLEGPATMTMPSGATFVTNYREGNQVGEGVYTPAAKPNNLMCSTRAKPGEAESGDDRDGRFATSGKTFFHLDLARRSFRGFDGKTGRFEVINKDVFKVPFGTAAAYLLLDETRTTVTVVSIAQGENFVWALDCLAV